jgi:hypothetical protein
MDSLLAIIINERFPVDYITEGHLSLFVEKLRQWIESRQAKGGCCRRNFVQGVSPFIPVLSPFDRLGGAYFLIR